MNLGNVRVFFNKLDDVGGAGRILDDAVDPVSGNVEKVYRTMSAKEFDRVMEAGGLVIRQKGSSELGITLTSDYLLNLMSRPKVAKNYGIPVEMLVKPGTWEELISTSAVHQSVASRFPDLPVYKKGMNVPMIKLEKGGVLSILLGSSKDAVKLFNKNLIQIRSLINVD